MCYPECTLKEEHPCSDGWNVEQEEGLQPQEEVSDVGDEAVVAQEQDLVEEQVVEQEQLHSPVYIAGCSQGFPLKHPLCPQT